MFNINEYLDIYGFDLNIDKKSILHHFIKDMENKLKGEESSLGMLNSYINTDGKLNNNSRVIVIDAGGTNLRVSALYFDNENNPVIEHFKQVYMPGTKGEVSLNKFFTEIAELIIPLDSYSNKIGFCFSYPVELENSSEGTVIKLCKEIIAPEVLGAKVCENLNRAIINLGGSKKKITLLNDSTATLLAGVSSDSRVSWDSYIGFILGTGSNSCYIEDYIINVESGWFDGVKRGNFDIELDKKSINPGSYFLEKMCSGAYLGQLATYVLKDLYSKGAIKSVVNNLSTKDINDFLIGKSSIFFEGDKEILYKVIDRIIERSALYIGINLAALIIKSGKGSNKSHPVCITADGSTFYNLKEYQLRVENYLKELLNEKYHYKFVRVENAPVIGAAIAALSD